MLMLEVVNIGTIVKACNIVVQRGYLASSKVLDQSQIHKQDHMLQS